MESMWRLYPLNDRNHKEDNAGRKELKISFSPLPYVLTVRVVPYSELSVSLQLEHSRIHSSLAVAIWFELARLRRKKKVIHME
jgi:hypothetical protein